MRVGELLAQRFRIERPAGAGAMGTVFRACDLAHAGRPVAVKVLPGLASQPRFEREVAALSSLNHDAVVRYVAHGRSEAGEAFVAMEWIDGQSLAERLTVSGLSGVETVQLAKRLASGLCALHASGIVHRDVKPSNVMLAAGRVEHARIVDLGIARLGSDAVSVQLTAAGAQLGTPRYMAPEQIRDPHAVDGRADVFALGCVLFEALTGAPAFPGDEAVSVLAQVLFGHTPEAGERRADLPDELEQLLERLLSRSRKLRPFADTQLLAELDRLLEPPLLGKLSAVPALPARAAATGSAPSFTQTSAGTAAGSHERPSYALLVSRPARQQRAQSRRSWPPAPHGPWVGRDAELSRLCGLLERERCVALRGGAGVGKTRLALETVRVLSNVHPDWTPLFCELGEARDSADVVRVVSERAGLPPLSHAEPEYVLGGLLAKLGELVLVLDRCEHLSGELEPLLTLWAASAPGLRVLVCSRARLRGVSELDLLPLGTRAASLPLSAADVPLSDAAELVLARSELALGAAAAGELARDPEACELAERIAAALDGNPLAIELAAARVPVLGLAGVEARLPAQLSLLADQVAGQTMRGAIAWSWDLLRESERLALAQCSVFRGSFTLDAAERVLVGEEPALALIQSLREQSLLSSAPLAGSSGLAVRLTMSAALREFAEVQLGLLRERSPELAGLRDRHARYYTELAAAGGGALRSEHDNLWAAAEHALDAQDVGAAAVLSLALEPALLAAGANSPRVALLERTLLVAMADPAHARSAARLRVLYARLLAPAGELERARAELEQVRVAAEALGDHALLGVCLLDLGVVLHFGRDLARAARCYESALDELSHADDVVAEARCHGNLGAVEHDQGRLHDAASGYRHAIALLEDGAEPRLLANFRGNLALIEHELGRPDSARRLYELAASGLEELCDARLLGIVLGNWGTLELTSGADSAALPLLMRAHALLEGCGDRRSFGLAIGRLAVAHALQDRVEDAERCIVNAERVLRRDALARVVASCLRGFVELGRARRALGEGDRERAGVEIERVRVRVLAVRSAEVGGRGACEQSDDLRVYCGLLEKEISRAAVAVESGGLAAG